MLLLRKPLELPAPLDQATDLLLTELRSRTGFLADVGLAYLTLDRQSRTLSGGEVERVNLASCLGTSLVDTLFVMDEPSVGLHPRDIDRLVKIIRTLVAADDTVLDGPCVTVDHLLAKPRAEETEL